MKEEHDKREADLQERLDTEKEILGKHQGDVAAMKGKEKDDDITRLKNQFAEERKEAEADHQRKMVEIRERGGAESQSGHQRAAVRFDYQRRYRRGTGEKHQTSC